MKFRILVFTGTLLMLSGCSRDTSVWIRETEILSEADTGIRLPENESAIPETEAEIAVYVCGAVKVPAVYLLKSGSRINDAVRMAGGFLENAAPDALNLAEYISDGQKVYVYTKEEIEQMQMTERTVISGADSSGIEALSDSGKVNINTADKEKLKTLPGVGDVKAVSIIQYREEHGAFQSVDEIQNVPGIKSSVFLKVKDLICI